DRLRTASVTEVFGGATLPRPAPLPVSDPPGVSNASLGFSSGWICGGGGACGIPCCGNFGPVFSVVSIFGGSGSAAIVGFGAGIDKLGAFGREIEGGDGGTWMRSRGLSDSTLNSLLILPRLGVVCVRSLGGSISAV